MNIFCDESDLFFEDNSHGKDFSTGQQDDISIFFEETYFKFNSPAEQLSPQPVIEEIQLEEKQQREERQESKQNQEIKKSGRSFHHNSQKHTVITIKHMVSLKGILAIDQSHEVMLKMWNLFIKGNKKTKEVLSVLFGAIDMGNQRDLKLFESYGFASILKYPMHSIRKAQDMLRKITVEQMSPAKVTDHLEKRRISQKNHFRLYLDGFIEQIDDGPLKSRLNKWKSYQINSLKQRDANLFSIN